MHYNLLFNGCSMTEGGELEGKEKDYEFQRTHRYSHLVAEHFGMSYDNIAVPGNNNDRIVRETIEWFEAGNTCDLAVIQFSYIERLEYICSLRNIPLKINTTLIHEHFWKVQESVRIYYEFSKRMITSYYKEVYNNNDAFYRYYKNLFLLETYFEKNNIKYIFLRVNNAKLNFDRTTTLWKNLCKNKYSDFTPLVGGILNKNYGNHEDYCEDISDAENPFLLGHHPSVLGHQKIADHLIKEISNAHFI